jgi:hypothetical protein
MEQFGPKMLDKTVECPSVACQNPARQLDLFPLIQEQPELIVSTAVGKEMLSRGLW